MSKRRIGRSSTLYSLVLLILSCAAAATAYADDRPAAGQYFMYFGDVHAHTRYSDGKGVPTQAFSAGRAAGADFMALTDHHYHLSTMEWADVQAAAAAATVAGEFVAMPGYEFWLPGIGEVNVFNTTVLPPFDSNQSPKGNPGHHANRWKALRGFYVWLASLPGAVGQWNHPAAYAGVSSENFAGYAYLTPDSDRAMGMIEVFNDLLYESSYIMALDKGWHVMPATSGDTHVTDWIAGSERRTVLLAESLTPGDLYAAMTAGRGYATLDSNLQVWFTLDGATMGSTLPVAPAVATAWVKVVDPDGVASDAITKVEIVSDGGQVVANSDAGGTSFEWTATLPATSARYFYVRVSTASTEVGPGLTAWTAPVWTGR